MRAKAGKPIVVGGASILPNFDVIFAAATRYDNPHGVGVYCTILKRVNTKRSRPEGVSGVVIRASTSNRSNQNDDGCQPALDTCKAN